MQVAFLATYLPAQDKFRVEMAASGHMWIELMSPSRFVILAHDTGPVVIGGKKIALTLPSERQAVRRYFQKSAAQYMAAHVKA